MKNLDCNQIKIFNNLETIGEDNDKKKKKKFYFLQKPNKISIIS